MTNICKQKNTLRHAWTGPPSHQKKMFSSQNKTESYQIGLFETRQAYARI